MAGKGSSGFWILIALVAIVMIPRDVWITIGVIAAIAAAIYAFIKWDTKPSSRTSSVPPQPSSPGHSSDEPTLAELMTRSSPAGGKPKHATASVPVRQASVARDDDFYTATLDNQSHPPRGHTLPKAPSGFSEGRWIPPHETVDVAGIRLPGGMFYLGTQLKAANGRPEPCLINPRLSVAHSGDFRERHTNYWPSYDDISPTMRRGYLSWLSEGRSHPDCNIGLVFLFFYGLERRVIGDTVKDESLKSEWPAIKDELHRLLGIYGEISGPFRRYAGELLNYMELDRAGERLYEQPLPSFPKTYELPPYIRLALGQAAINRAPVPAGLLWHGSG